MGRVWCGACKQEELVHTGMQVPEMGRGNGFGIGNAGNGAGDKGVWCGACGGRWGLCTVAWECREWDEGMALGVGFGNAGNGTREWLCGLDLGMPEMPTMGRGTEVCGMGHGGRWG